jgi:hypothetical protein
MVIPISCCCSRINDWTRVRPRVFQPAPSPVVAAVYDRRILHPSWSASRPHPSASRRRNLSSETVILSKSSRHSSTPALQHSAFPLPTGSQPPLSSKLFSLLQIHFFGGKTPFTGSLQGFFRGHKPRFWPCILYPRWAVAFSNPCFNSPMNAESSSTETDNTNRNTTNGAADSTPAPPSCPPSSILHPPSALPSPAPPSAAPLPQPANRMRQSAINLS